MRQWTAMIPSGRHRCSAGCWPCSERVGALTLPAEGRNGSTPCASASSRSPAGSQAIARLLAFSFPPLSSRDALAFTLGFPGSVSRGHALPRTLLHARRAGDRPRSPLLSPIALISSTSFLNLYADDTEPLLEDTRRRD